MTNTELRPFSEMGYHPLSQKIVDSLAITTQNSDKGLFHAMLPYYWGVCATHMRASITGWFDNKLPMNIYSICLAESGTGKGYTVGTVESQIINGFKEVFLEETFPVAGEEGIEDIAIHRAAKRGTQVDAERNRLYKEYEDAGNMVFSFSKATPAAIKQIRHKLIIANAGSLNFQIDEIGGNLLNSDDALQVMLELYDRGDIKDNLIKNSAENKRNESLTGFTPSNLLMFGASSALLNGSDVETKFMHLLETGYARRSFFSFNQEANKETELTAEEIVERMFNQHHTQMYNDVSAHLEAIADVSNLDREINIPRESCLYLVRYKLNCEDRARTFKTHQKIQKAEMQHRYFKVMKLAACYSFIDNLDEITIQYLEYAIRVAEDSGDALNKLLNPDKDFMRLARFLCEQETDVTLPDIEMGLPCFYGANGKKMDMINLATAWGYKNNVLITKSWVDQILFLNAKVLEETNLDELFISVSGHEARDYENMVVTFEDLGDLGNKRYMHWINHHLEDGYRDRDHVIPGFNAIVLDIDDGTPIEAAMAIFEGLYAVYYDTKSSTKQHNRYRVILPISHVLEFEQDDYAEFMNNILSVIPIEVDSSVCEREHKWQTWDAGADVIDTYWNGKEDADCKLFDILEFIPRTSKNEERIKRAKQYEGLDGLQHWVMSTTGEGNRNKQLYRYAMILVDKGYDYNDIHEHVKQMNDGLRDGISDKEIANTIMSTVARKIGNK